MQVGYFYYLADKVWYANPTDPGLRGMIDSRLVNVKNINLSVMDYTQISSFPATLGDYDVLIISCPGQTLTLSSSELAQLNTWANHCHRRIVFVGDDLYSDGAFNARLNSIKDAVCANFPDFRTSGYEISSPYNQGICYDFGTTRPWLTSGVSSLNYASFGWFNYSGAYVSQIDSTYKWIVEVDCNGGMCLGIHDYNLFNYSNSNPFVLNFCTKFE